MVGNAILPHLTPPSPFVVEKKTCLKTLITKTKKLWPGQ